MVLTAIIWFIIAHVAFLLVSKLVLRKISLVFYLLMAVLFLVFFYGISWYQIESFTGAAIAKVLALT
jgi:hypothetical protein